MSPVTRGTTLGDKFVGTRKATGHDHRRHVRWFHPALFLRPLARTCYSVMERHRRLLVPLLSPLLPLLSKLPIRGRRFAWHLARLGELVDYQVPRDAVLYNGMPLVVFLGTTEGRAILANGVYEPHSVHLLEQIILPGMTFVDVGANVGQYSVVAGRLAGPSGTIYAIEPSPRVSDYLEKNIDRNKLANVQVCRLAISDYNGEIDFYLSAARKIGTSSVFRNRRSSGAKICVPCKTLDAFACEMGLDRIDIVKIDIEGAEYTAIQGAPGVFSGSQPPIVFIEFNEYMLRRAGTSCAKLYGLLRGLGYTMFRPDEGGASRYTLAHALAQSEASKEVNVLAWPPNRSLPPFIDPCSLNRE